MCLTLCLTGLFNFGWSPVEDKKWLIGPLGLFLFYYNQREKYLPYNLPLLRKKKTKKKKDKRISLFFHKLEHFFTFLVEVFGLRGLERTWPINLSVLFIYYYLFKKNIDNKKVLYVCGGRTTRLAMEWFDHPK
jgi:hypothetical protein